MNIHPRVALWSDSRMEDLIKMVESGNSHRIESSIFKAEPGLELHTQMIIDGEEASVVLPIKAMVSASQPHSILIIGNRFSEFNEFGESSFDYVFRLSTGTGGTPECRRFGRWLVSHHSKVRALLEYDYRPLFTRGTKRKVGYDPTSLSNYQVFLDLARKIHKFRSWIQDKAGVLPKCRKRDLVL